MHFRGHWWPHKLVWSRTNSISCFFPSLTHLRSLLSILLHWNILLLLPNLNLGKTYETYSEKSVQTLSTGLWLSGTGVAWGSWLYRTILLWNTPVFLIVADTLTFFWARAKSFPQNSIKWDAAFLYPFVLPWDKLQLYKNICF